MHDLNYKNLKFKHLICYLLFDLYTFFFMQNLNYKNLEDIRKKKKKSLMNLSKFTSNKYILNKVIAFCSNQVIAELHPKIS